MKKYLISGSITLALLGGLGGGYYFMRASKESSEIQSVPNPIESGVLLDQAAAPDVPKSDSKAPEAKVDRFIEEEFAEAGEDLGAVYFMSRIREAIREGNPSFARELLRQMKEEHSGSALLEEAESLCGDRQKKSNG